MSSAASHCVEEPLFLRHCAVGRQLFCHIICQTHLNKCVQLSELTAKAALTALVAQRLQGGTAEVSNKAPRVSECMFSISAQVTQGGLCR